METNARYMLVGAFVLLLTLGAVFFVIWMGKAELTTNTRFYDIYFQGSVTGLKNGAQVLYRGVPIGSVSSIAINPQEMEYILVRVSIDKTVPLYEDSVASLEMQGITGIAFVQIKGGNPESSLLKIKDGNKYPIILSKPSKLEEIFDAAPKLIKNVNNLSHNLNSLISGDNQKNVTLIIDNIQTITHTLSEQSQTFENLIKNANIAFENLQDMSERYKILADTVEKHLVPTLEITHGFLMDNREPLNVFLNSGLYEFSSTLSELKRTLASINRVAQEIERDPLTFLLGITDEGYPLK